MMCNRDPKVKKRRILIIDDENDYAEIVKEGCAVGQGEKYEVHLETRAEKAVETARTFRPHLIILDIVMPQTNGIDVARRIRTDPELKDTPVAFITATLLEGTLKDLGGKVYGRPCLLKPFDIATLSRFIQRIMNPSRAA